MYTILFYKTIDNYIEKRAPYREEHLKYAEEAEARSLDLSSVDPSGVPAKL